MIFRNTERQFGLVAIIFHWLMAVIIIGLLALGLYMTSLPNSLEKLKLYGWHKEFGLLVLMLAVLRLAWRFSNMTPLLSGLPAWERISARTVHWLFYGFMFAQPITGWLITSAAGVPPSFFGLFVLPGLVAPDKDLRRLFDHMHEWLAYGLIAVIILHVCAALKHHFYDRDEILRRML